MMRNLRMYSQDFTRYLTSSLTQDDWRRLAICWNDNISFGIFDTLRATLNDPTFLFAFYPVSGSWRPIIDLFNLWQAKPKLIHQALEAYHQSPHYHEAGMEYFRDFPVEPNQQEAKTEFTNLIIEQASHYQLIDMGMVHESAST